MRPLPTGEPWGDYAVSTAQWTGARLSDVLALVKPAGAGVDVRFEGADHGSYHLQAILPETKQDDLTFMRALPLAEAIDSSSDILVAYEMNGEPLRPDHGAPFRLIVPHWYAVASVKWLRRIDVLTEPYTGEFQTGHYIYSGQTVRTRPCSLMRVRARITDPAPSVGPSPRALHGPWKGMVRNRTGDTGRHQPHRRRRVASGGAGPAEGPYQWQDWSFVWDCGASVVIRCVPGRPTRPATSNPTSLRGTGWATATTPSRSCSSTALIRRDTGLSWSRLIRLGGCQRPLIARGCVHRPSGSTVSAPLKGLRHVQRQRLVPAGLV